MPCSRITRTAFGCSGLGWLPALAAVTASPAICSKIAWAICERALFPVHKNSTLARTRTGPGSRRAEPQPGVQRRAGRGEQFAAAGQVDAVVGVTAVR